MDVRSLCQSKRAAGAGVIELAPPQFRDELAAAGRHRNLL